MHTYPWHVGDYLRDCSHLSDDEDLAYRRLMDHYYSQEGAIPDKTNWVAKRIRMVGKEAVVGSVLKEFFEKKDGFWHQKRCDEEITKYQRRAASARQNGEKGGRPKQEPNGLAKTTDPAATRTRTNNHKKTPLTPEGGVAFEVFWTAYPRKEKKPKALEAFAKALTRGAKPDEIAAGLVVHIGSDQWTRDGGRFIPLPATWLNADSWNDRPLHGGAAVGVVGNWWDSRAGIERKGAEFGIEVPIRSDSPEAIQAWNRFMAGVWVKAGDGPWWDDKSMAYPIARRLRDGGESHQGRAH